MKKARGWCGSGVFSSFFLFFWGGGQQRGHCLFWFFYSFFIGSYPLILNTLRTPCLSERENVTTFDDAAVKFSPIGQW